MWGRSMRSDGGCHNIPATFTNTLPRLTNPPILRFQELDAINCGEDDGDDVDNFEGDNQEDDGDGDDDDADLQL